MYHGDLTEKLKVLYKLHLPPGEWSLSDTATTEHGLFWHAVENSSLTNFVMLLLIILDILTFPSL